MSRITRAFATLGLKILTANFLTVVLVGASSFLASTTRAGTVNMNPGDTLLIQPNTLTTVVCGGSGPGASNCTATLTAYESRYKTCKKSYPPSTCFSNEWSNFKKHNPHCLTEAFDLCVKTCEESYAPSTCYNNCR